MNIGKLCVDEVARGHRVMILMATEERASRLRENLLLVTPAILDGLFVRSSHNWAGLKALAIDTLIVVDYGNCNHEGVALAKAKLAASIHPTYIEMDRGSMEVQA